MTSTANPKDARAGTERLLEAATALFAERGYDGVSAQELAQAAGTSKANLFHHFGSKQALYSQALIAACERFRDELDRALAGASDLRDLLARLIRWHRARLAQKPNESQLVLREITQPRFADDCGPVQEAMMASFRHLLDRIRSILPPGPARDDPRIAVLAHLIIANNVFDFLASPLLQAASAELHFVRAADYPDRLAELLIDGLSLH